MNMSSSFVRYLLWRLIAFTLFPLPSFSGFVFNKTFHVRLETTKSIITYEIQAPEDYYALDSVLISGIYNKYIGKVLRVVVEETGLSTEDIPAESFFVSIKDHYRYELILNTINPQYIMTVIQVTKHLQSNSEVYEITSPASRLSLFQMPARWFSIETPGGQRLNYKINSTDDDMARLAFEIAAQLARNQSPISLDHKSSEICANLF